MMHYDSYTSNEYFSLHYLEIRVNMPMFASEPMLPNNFIWYGNFHTNAHHYLVDF